METKYNVAIIGGGASGLAAASMLGGKRSAIVLERMDRVGKKLAATGNGRGNVTNENLSAMNYHSREGDAAQFVAPALEAFGTEETKKFLASIGCMTATENGRVYPSSLQAASLVDLMRIRLSSLGVEMKTGAFVEKIEKRGAFALTVGGEVIEADNVIISAGGRSHREFGTDGNGYDLARSLGHTVTELSPSIVRLKTDMNDIKSLKGIRADVKLTLFGGNRAVACERGDILFTDCGVSGDAVFRISTRTVGLANPVLSVCFLPDADDRELKNFLMKKAQTFAAGDLLTGVTNKLVGRAIVASLGIAQSEKCPESHINAIISRIRDFRINVKGTLGFDEAQVTRGGVRTNEVDPATMQSKKVKGLYFTGEVLDVDGDCGGYNLQWAFSSAAAAARAIGEKR